MSVESKTLFNDDELKKKSKNVTESMDLDPFCFNFIFVFFFSNLVLDYHSGEGTQGVF